MISQLLAVIINNFILRFVLLLGGLLALSGAALGDPYKNKYMKIGGDITFTCQQFYTRSSTGLAPTLFDFNEPKSSNPNSEGTTYYFKSLIVLGYIRPYQLDKFLNKI